MPDELKPKFERPRPRCPFYGFCYTPGGIIDQAGNQCATITGKYNPCQMEFDSQEVDWAKCSFNNTQARICLEMIMDLYRVFPQEFRPEGDCWEGISFRKWYDYVMKKS